MSKEQVESFLKKVHEDEALAKEFQGCFAVLHDLKGKTPKEQEVAVIGKVVELGQSQGYDFDPAEAHRAYRDEAAQAGNELSDEELEQVAGGKGLPKVSKQESDENMAVFSWMSAGTICALGSILDLDGDGNTKKNAMAHCMGPMIGKPS